MRTFISTLIIFAALSGIAACDKKVEIVPTAAEQKAQDEADRQKMAEGIADDLEDAAKNVAAIDEAVKKRLAPNPDTAAPPENPPPKSVTVEGTQAIGVNFGTLASTVTVNGVTIKGGQSIVVRNGKVIVDGKDVTPDAKSITISVNGNVNELKADTCQSISISGNTGAISTVSGNLHAEGAINGSVNTMSGDITSGSISGNASSMSGDVSCRR